MGKQAEQQPKGRLIGELIQNALDEAGVTQIAVTLAPVPGRPQADLAVEDDSPEGFRDLAHAYTLFADSYKRGNPEQRGQFNLGEKMVLAVCESASISTTKVSRCSRRWRASASRSLAGGASAGGGPVHTCGPRPQPAA